MSDIVSRLNEWRDERGFPTPGELMDEAAAEIARLRLTDAEREFLQNLHGAYEELANQTGYVNAAAQKESREHAALLRGLLEKHK